MENTMTQTVGEQFLEWYNRHVKEHGCSPSDFDVNFFWTHNFLEKEKEQQNDFAIGFAEFSINYNYHPTHKVWIRYDKMANEKFYTKELLEIYKKEKGL
jgi:hypothetical protein